MRRNNLSKYVRYLPFYGCISTGIIYLGIGVIAILSFFKIKEGGADESSLLVYLNEYILGKIFVWIILLGTVSYVIWRLFEAITDPYQYGNNGWGISKRIGIALSTIADAMIASSAIQILLGIGNAHADGSPDEERRMVASLLERDWGSALIIVIGGIIFITAVIQFLYGVTKGYKERLDMATFKKRTKNVIHILAWIGYFARGLILSIISFFLIKAAILKDPEHVVNTDKAFDFLGDYVGHASFLLVAMGTICYAIFMFALGVTYDADKD